MYKMTVVKLYIFDKIDVLHKENTKNYCKMSKTVIYYVYEND